MPARISPSGGLNKARVGCNHLLSHIIGLINQLQVGGARSQPEYLPIVGAQLASSVSIGVGA